MPQGCFRTRLGSAIIRSLLSGTSSDGLFTHPPEGALPQVCFGISIVILCGPRMSIGYRTAGYAKDAFQKCRSPRGVEGANFCSRVIYRVTSQTKAMEDAVEIGLRSAFNEVGFTSFNRVLSGVKLKGEHPSPRDIQKIAHTP